MESSNVDYGDKVKGLGQSIGLELLTPTEIYVRRVMKALQKVAVSGMVDVTGGGLRNFLRLRKGVSVVFDDPLRPQPVFRVLQELGKVEDREMYQTFNMGMGFALICPEEEAQEAVTALGEGAKVVGRVQAGEGVHLPSLRLSYLKY